MINASIFSPIKYEAITTLARAPIARTIVHKETEVRQFAFNLHKVPMVKPSIPCNNKYVIDFTGPDRTNNNTVVATIVFLPASIPHLIVDSTIGKAKKQAKYFSMARELLKRKARAETAANIAHSTNLKVF